MKRPAKLALTLGADPTGQAHFLYHSMAGLGARGLLLESVLLQVIIRLVKGKFWTTETLIISYIVRVQPDRTEPFLSAGACACIVPSDVKQRKRWFGRRQTGNELISTSVMHNH